MSVSVAALPPKTLAKLKDGPTICVQRKRTPTSEPVILDSFFPKGIATAFSSTWSALFPPVNQIAVGNMGKAHPTTLTITGGDLDSIKAVLIWMKSCCTGRGLEPFQHVPRGNKPFYHYYMYKEAASIIGCSYLEKKLGDRMEALATTQIHSEDVRALWLYLPDGHDVRQYLADHVATLIWNHDLKAFPAYKTLREELPDFNAAINAILDPKAEARYMERKAERDAYYQKLRDERKEMAKKEANKKKKKVVNPQKTKPEEVKENTTAAPQPKLPVPGADEVSTIPYLKNKAAKRRAKKRQEKAKDVEA